MQYFIQIRRADGSTYPTTVEADSLADARRKAQFVTEGGETVENITENTSDVGATTTQAMNNAFADGPTTLDELYRQFEIQRAQPESGINQQLGTGETGTPIRTTGTEATGVGFQPGAETQMRSVPNQTVDVGNLSSTYLEPPAPASPPPPSPPPAFEVPPDIYLSGDFSTPPERQEYANFNNYIDRFLSDNARISGFARGVDKLAPGQGLGQSILYRSGPIGQYFSSLQPEAEATYMAEDITRNFGKDKPGTMQTFDDFTADFLQGGTGNTLFEKQTASFGKLLTKYRNEQEAGLESTGQGIASAFSDRSDNKYTVSNLIRGMANTMYGANYMRYVSPDTDALYDAWSRDQANKLRQVDSAYENEDEEAVKKAAGVKQFAGKTSFLEYTANAYGVPADQNSLNNFTKNQFMQTGSN